MQAQLTINSRGVVTLPERDRPVLLAAMVLVCNVLVAGDCAHFGPGYGNSFEGVLFAHLLNWLNLFDWI